MMAGRQRVLYKPTLGYTIPRVGLPTKTQSKTVHNNTNRPLAGNYITTLDPM